MRTFRARSDETHFAFNDVPELRNFVHANFANNASDTRRAVVVVRRPDRLAVGFGINFHRAKLDDFDDSAVFPDALLFVKNLAFGIEFD